MARKIRAYYNGHDLFHEEGRYKVWILEEPDPGIGRVELYVRRPLFGGWCFVMTWLFLNDQSELSHEVEYVMDFRRGEPSLIPVYKAASQVIARYEAYLKLKIVKPVGVFTYPGVFRSDHANPFITNKTDPLQQGKTQTC